MDFDVNREALRLSSEFDTFARTVQIGHEAPTRSTRSSPQGPREMLAKKAIHRKDMAAPIGARMGMRREPSKPRSNDSRHNHFMLETIRQMFRP